MMKHSRKKVTFQPAIQKRETIVSDMNPKSFVSNLWGSYQCWPFFNDWQTHFWGQYPPTKKVIEPNSFAEVCVNLRQQWLRNDFRAGSGNV